MGGTGTWLVPTTAAAATATEAATATAAATIATAEAAPVAIAATETAAVAAAESATKSIWRRTAKVATAAKGIKTLFAETVALVASATATPSVVTHSPVSTLPRTPTYSHGQGCRTARRPCPSECEPPGPCVPGSPTLIPSHHSRLSAAMRMI